MEPGVNLYSRQILIENKPKDLLPEWLRFIKGVVDSEDLPLSISREKSQDSTLLRRIRDVLTRKIIRFLDEQVGTAYTLSNPPPSFFSYHHHHDHLFFPLTQTRLGTIPSLIENSMPNFLILSKKEYVMIINSWINCQNCCCSNPLPKGMVK